MRHLTLIVLGVSILAFVGCESRQRQDALVMEVQSLKDRLAAAEKTIEKLSKPASRTGKTTEQAVVEQRLAAAEKMIEQLSKPTHQTAELRARQFVLVDENDKPRAFLSMINGEALLSLLDPNGKIRVSLSASEGGPSLDLLDANGKPRATLGVDKDGQPNLDLSGTNGKVSATLGVDQGGSSLSLRDANGKTRASLSALNLHDHLGGSLDLFDAKGRPKASLEVLDVNNGAPVFCLRDPNGKIRTMLTASEDGSSLSLLDANGKTRALLSANLDKPVLFIYDANGKVIWQAPLQKEQMGQQRSQQPWYEMPEKPRITDTEKKLAIQASYTARATSGEEFDKLSAAQDLKEYNAIFEDWLKRIPFSEYIRDELRQKYFLPFMKDNIKKEYRQSETL